MNRYASRKFILSILSLASASWIVFEKVITTGDYKAVVIGTVGAYIIGNVAQKAVSKDASVA